MKRCHLIAFAAVVFAYAVSPAHAMLGADDPNAAVGISEAKKLIEKKMYTEAIVLLDGAIPTTENKADAWNMHGFSYRMLGKFDTAEASYTKALEADPKHLGALNYMGQMFVQTGRLEDARGMLARLKDACGDCTAFGQLDTAIKEGKAGNY